MIGNPNWFSRRKYTGWGFTPRTWQGWAYIIVMILPVVFIATMDTVNAWALAFLIVWAIVFAADFVHIAIHLPKDERERIHEAIAERNALWAMLIVLVVAVGYQAAASIATHTATPEVDPFILAALAAAVIAKAVSNLYLNRKN